MAFASGDAAIGAPLVPRLRRTLPPAPRHPTSRTCPGARARRTTMAHQVAARQLCALPLQCKAACYPRVTWPGDTRPHATSRRLARSHAEEGATVRTVRDISAGGVILRDGADGCEVALVGRGRPIRW